MSKRLFPVILSFWISACQVIIPLDSRSAASVDAAHNAKPVSIMPRMPSGDFGVTPLKEWVDIPYKPQGDELPVNLEMVENPEVIGGLTNNQTGMLVQNGFTVIYSSEEQFADIRDQVADYYGQPYYLTTDAAFHALLINFDALLKQLERTVLREEAITIVSAVLNSVSKEAETVQDDHLRRDFQLAEEYLSVARILFAEDPSMTAAMRKRIQPQVEQVMTASGRAKSVLISGFEDDYGAYTPVGHYAGDPDLEAYFRGMTWLGRVALKFRDVENEDFFPSRVPLVISRVLRDNAVIWERYLKMMETLEFVAGPTDDAGPPEVLALMDEVYGRNPSWDELSDDRLWQEFLSRANELPRPQINSTFANSTMALNAERSWRMMGQRFTLDGLMFQNLVFDKVGSQNNKREVPSGLDVMAVLGSTAALEAQKEAGEDQYDNYLKQVERLSGYVRTQRPPQWLDTFYSGWLYAFIPQVQPKGESYPPLMRTFAWQNRETNSALGSWAELKHDTALYTKMPEFMGGGGPPVSPPPPGYVEPNPNVFYRLAYVSMALKEGLESRGYCSGNEERPGAGSELSFMDLWRGMGSLGDQFTRLGDIAVKELRGEELTEEDRYRIIAPLGKLEDHVAFAKRTGQGLELPPVPVVAAVSGAQNEVLEAGVGYVDRIFVAVPVNGKMYIAQGGVFSYYEFAQPRSNRLTDEEWQKNLKNGAYKLLPYTSNYMEPGGKPVDELAFRIGDLYIITSEGGSPPLNLRVDPSKNAAVLGTLKTDTYLEIIDGPKQADELTWWKIEVYFSSQEEEGWVAENPDWYARAHGQ
ncbi:MAG: DUF3160 domain-containing protein [Leptolinea sp.]|nr:DUF3160 domain-containing protein [Leptolinea sp.]